MQALLNQMKNRPNICRYFFSPQLRNFVCGCVCVYDYKNKYTINLKKKSTIKWVSIEVDMKGIRNYTPDWDIYCVPFQLLIMHWDTQ